MNDSIYYRRSIRKYSDKQVPKEMIAQIFVMSILESGNLQERVE